MTGNSNPHQPRTRDDLLRLIADAIRAHMLSINDAMALALADAVLRRFRAAGLAIMRNRWAEGRP